MENKNQNNGQGFAIASMVIGIFALLFSLIPCVGTLSILFGIVAVVFGSVSLSKANAQNQPKGMSIAGISLGGAALFISVLMTVFIFGSKSIIKDKIKEELEWTKTFDDLDNLDENFEEMENLDDLEQALDDLEGAVDDISREIDESATEIHNDVKKALKDAKSEIEDAKQKTKETDKK